MIDVLELTLPDDAADPLWSAYARMSVESSREAVGPSGTPITPVEMLVQSQQAEQKRGIRIMRWLARAEGKAVGFARLRIDSSDNRTGGTVLVHVDAEHRGRGISRVLAQTIREAVPATMDHLGAEVMTPVPQGEVLEAASGGAVAADHPGVRLALCNGFELAQVMWFQRLEFSVPAQRWVAAETKARQLAGPEYEVLTFEGVPPEELRAGVAVLKQRMSTDAPHGAVILSEARWDAERVVRHYEALGATQRVFVALVVHRASGQVVALNDLAGTRGRPDAPLHQRDTLVLPAHRGRRLGLLVKAANLMAVRVAVPQAPSVLTFNAYENQHMLAINDELGFERRGTLGLFQLSRKRGK